jgi:hypothetical protein
MGIKPFAYSATQRTNGPCILGRGRWRQSKIADGKPSADQLHEEIHKMLVERAKAQAAANLEYAITCFEMDE